MGTYGVMSGDHEVRCDYEKLRRDRLLKTRAQMKKEGLGAILVFEQDHIRYITGTKIGEWNHTIRNRYVLLCEGQEPILFENGSAIPAKRLLSPFIKDIRPNSSDMKGVLPPDAGGVQRGVDEIVSILKEHNLQDAPLGVDDPFFSWVDALQKAGIKVVDGQQCMLNAQTIKTPEEIYLIEMSAAMVDAGFYNVLQAAKPGVREIELSSLMRDTCLKLGAECVHNAQVTSGNRTFPHPHDVSDRFIRPGDMIFMDVVCDYMGYKTCYYRTFMCGKPTQNQKDVYNTAYKIVKDTMDVSKAGVMTSELVKLWPSAKDVGYDNDEEGFLLQLCHGIGITHWAKPAILPGYSEQNPIPLEENMVIAYENYYHRNGDAARIEEEAVITKDGVRTLTRFPMETLLTSWDW